MGPGGTGEISGYRLLLTCSHWEVIRELISIPLHKLLISGYSWWVVGIIWKIYMGIYFFWEKNHEC